MRVTIIVALLMLDSTAWSQMIPLVPSEIYTNTIILDENDPGLYQVYYKRVSVDEIQFEVHCRNLGWVGFGISPAGTMSGSDIAKFWVKDGIVFLFDTHAVGNIPPRIDTVYNLDLLGGAEMGAYTMVKWKRKLVTGDRDHDLDIVNAPQFIIAAWNPNDPVTAEGDWLYHGSNRYIRQVNLLAGRWFNK